MSETTTNQDPGYYIGVGDLVCAPMVTKPTSTTAPTYGDVIKLANGIEFTISPKYKEGQLYASDRVQRRAKRVDSYEVKCKIDQLTKEGRMAITSRSTDSNGVEIIDGDDDPPMIALGIDIHLDDGNREMWWMVQGSFGESETTVKTSEDKVEYQVPTITGIFDRRANDNVLAYVADTSDSKIPTNVIEGWFESVYAPTASTDATETV